MSAVEPARADVEAQLRAMQSLCRGTAVKLVRRLGLPTNIELDDLVQAGMVGAWQAAERFDGRGSLPGFAAQRIRGAMLDYLRQEHPAGRGGPEIHLVSLDDTSDDGHSLMPDLVDEDADPAEQVERRQSAQQRLRSLTEDHRSVVSEVLEGRTLAAIGARRGYSESRACQVAAESVARLNGARERTPDTFDPAAVRIKVGAKIPDPRRMYRNRFRELMNRMPATGSVELAPTPAASLIAELKKAGIAYCRRTLDSGLVQVTREPAPEQFEE